MIRLSILLLQELSAWNGHNSHRNEQKKEKVFIKKNKYFLTPLNRNIPEIKQPNR